MATPKTAAKSVSPKEKQAPQKNSSSLQTPAYKRKEKSEIPAPKTPESSQPEVVADRVTAPSLAPSSQANAVRMPAINDVRIAGRLTREPVVREVGTQKVANFDIAIEKRYRDGKNEWQKQVSYVPCAAWGVVADRAKDFLHKGSPVYVEGRLRSQSWTTQDGQRRSGMRLEAFKVQSLARGQSQSQGQEMGD